MVTHEDVMVKKTITKWHCDFCDYTTTNNKGMCGVHPVMQCSICENDMCREHTAHYQEDMMSDYDDAQVCPDCNERFLLAWNWALYNANRGDDLFGVAIKRMKEVQDE